MLGPEFCDPPGDQFGREHARGVAWQVERFGHRSAKLRIADAEAALVDKTKAAARATDDYVNDNPWQAVGIAAGIGFLLGVIIGRR